MRLAGAITQGSGTYNEDGYGLIEQHGQVSAAWVFDGVTGINGENYLPAASDAQWLVERAHLHLSKLAAMALTLPDILQQLVDCLIADWNEISPRVRLPAGYDHPAACLLLVKRYPNGWQVLRLGDSFLLTRGNGVVLHPSPPSSLNDFEDHLRREARRRRAQGMFDFKALLAEFRHEHLANRMSRNTPGNYGILVADSSALCMPQLLDLGWPKIMLLCTDGFYRAVDTYGVTDDAGILAACAVPGGATNMLSAIRAAEAADPLCQRHLRFKPADDATAICLVSEP